MSKNTTTPLRHFGLACAGAALAASTWATGIQEPGLMLDGKLWREEVVAPNGEWAEEGWFELTVGNDSVAVRSARPDCGDENVPRDAMYLHAPGTRILEGVRVNHLFPAAEFRPRVGHEYKLTLGKTDFSFEVESSGAGTQLVVRYEGTTHNYLLGLPAAATRMHAVADLDGDRRPDFLVEVGGQIFLLLSTHAKPGTNLPSAQLWAAK